FRETGLALDHANCHKHMHLHPTVAGLVLKVGAEYGLKALRLPYEPARSWSVSCSAGKMASWLFLLPWAGLLRRKIRKAGVHSNDFVFGLGDTGSMGLQKVLRFLDRLPPGVTEMYFHPAVRNCPELSRESGHSRHVLEFAALVDPAFRRALAAAKIRRISFCDLPLR
ncbi:MAG TPA: ChbG/HpnK family deacetylase, partial [Syntrophales bacterium]|nr:ChbG/HpnK family deacetylase [Syntrophales bacterium]